MRVVAYCRVSSEHNDQLNSLENQKQHWEEYIKSCPDMEFAGLYIDEGISGTSTLKRVDFNRMIDDAGFGKFDMILTKEVSRFGRNIVDVLKHTRDLKEKGVGVYFESDGINTLDNDGELRLSIMATLAQEESRKTSERVKWGHKRAMKNGIVFGNDRVLGYDLINKRLVINEKEAEIIRDIYSWFLEGKSLHQIAEELGSTGTKGKKGGQLTHSSIREILQNEKYCGDLKQGKNYTDNYLTHKQSKNRGKKELIVIEDNHTPIIDKISWNRVQTLLAERRIKYRSEGMGFSRHVWGGKLVCAICGSKFRRKVFKNSDGSDRPVWKCSTAYDKGAKACLNGSYIREDILEHVVMDAFKQIVSDDIRHLLVKNLVNALYKSLEESNTDKVLGDISRQLLKVSNKKKKLMHLFMDEDSAISKEELNEQYGELNNQQEKLTQQLNNIKNRTSTAQSRKQRINKICEYMSCKLVFNDFNNALVRESMDKIIIDKNKLLISLLLTEFEVVLDNYTKGVNKGDYSPLLGK